MMTMMMTTIEEQLARLARDIDLAGGEEKTAATSGETSPRVDEAERRVRSVVRSIAERLGGDVCAEGREDDIALALELVVERLLSPDRARALAA